MHDLFISYAREDEAWVERFCDRLISQGFSIWKDSSIPTGKPFGRVIEDAITNTRSVIVVWSHNSVESDWVRAEATEGLQRGILMPVSKDNTPPPLRFRTIQTINLSKWKFEPGHSEFQRLVDEIRSQLESTPTYTNKSSSKQTIQPPPTQKRDNRFFWTAVGILLAAGLGAAIWFWDDENKRRDLSANLVASSIEVLDKLNAKQQTSTNYWGYFLSKEGGQSLVEQSVLLALEGVRLDPTPEAMATLRRSLVLLQRPLKEFKYTNNVDTATISSDSTRLALSARNKGILILNTSQEEMVSQLEIDEQVAGLFFLENTNYLVSVGREEGALVTWNVSTGKKLSTVSGNGARVIGFARNADSSRIAVRQTGLMTVWELRSGKQISTIETDTFVNLNAVQSLDLSPDGRYLAFAPKDQVRVWDLEKNAELYLIKLDSYVSSLQFDPMGKTLTIFSMDGDAKVVVMGYGDEKNYSGLPFTSLSRFSPDAVYMARTSASRIQVSTEGVAGKTILEYTHGDNIKDIRFSPSGRLIATAGQDGMVRIWDIGAAQELSRFSYLDRVLAIRFSPDEKTLTTITKNGRVGIWPIAYSDPIVEACRGLRRNLTIGEWKRYLPGLSYRKTCPAVQS